MAGLLTKRSVLLAKVESVPGTDAAPTPTANAVRVIDPQFTVDPQVLTPQYSAPDLSRFRSIIGRTVAGMTFTVEVVGNGLQNSGVLGDAPILAELMRGCGYALNATDGAGNNNLGEVVPGDSNAATTDVSFAKGGTVSVVAPVLYTITCTTGGASGVAEVTITGNNDAEDDLASAVAETITDAAPLSLGAKGGTITPTITGNLTAGDKWVVLAYPVGVMAKPVSDNFETLTLWMYRDGILHQMQNAQGSFTIEATAGDFARVAFNFIGTFNNPTDVAVPTNAVYPNIQPPQVELSLFTWGSNVDTIVEAWNYDAGNDIQVRLDVNAQQGYRGSRIADRQPVGGFNPEVELEATEPFWNDFLAGRTKSFTARIGTTAGNQMIFFAPAAQTTDQQYTDRNGLMAYDKSVGFTRGALGNDEAIFLFG